MSPALQSLKIDLLRAPPSAVNIIARPTVTQPGYAAYVNHIAAFMKASNENVNISLVSQGYPTNYPIDQCLPLNVPSVVIDYGTTPPAKYTEKLGKLGFERIKMQKNDHVLRFPEPTLDMIREIKTTNPQTRTPCPQGAINLESVDTWVLVIRVLSSFLSTHVYPAFRDDGHLMEHNEVIQEQIPQKRAAPTELAKETVKKARKDDDDEEYHDDNEEDMEMEEEEVVEEPPTVILHKAKPSDRTIKPWGTPEQLPNASGLFFPFVPELASYDDTTIPRLFEDYLLQALGNTPEQQLERFARIKSAWGIISKTESGNVLAHMGKVIHLSITSQGRCFPLIHDGIYQGCVLSGGRLFVGLNGNVYRPLSFDKLQEETGNYQLHSRVLANIAAIANGADLDGKTDTVEAEGVIKAQSLREVRSWLLKAEISEADRDEIRKLAVHLHFKNDSHLPVNPQTIKRVLDDMTLKEDDEDMTLPLHHSALFSRDKVLVSLAAFGFQAPSFNIDNCPKIALKDAKPPTTLVIRQKPLDIATLDWKRMIENKEIRNNPRNLSRANRDRTLTANDKIMIWGKLKEVCGAMVIPIEQDTEEGGVGVEPNDGLDEW